MLRDSQPSAALAAPAVVVVSTARLTPSLSLATTRLCQQFASRVVGKASLSLQQLVFSPTTRPSRIVVSRFCQQVRPRIVVCEGELLSRQQFARRACQGRERRQAGQMRTIRGPKIVPRPHSGRRSRTWCAGAPLQPPAYQRRLWRRSCHQPVRVGHSAWQTRAHLGLSAPHLAGGLTRTHRGQRDQPEGRGGGEEEDRRRSIPRMPQGSDRCGRWCRAVGWQGRLFCGGLVQAAA